MSSYTPHLTIARNTLDKLKGSDLTAEDIHSKLQKFNETEQEKGLWIITLGAFKKEFWQPFKKENNVKLKPGRRAKT